MNKRDTIFLFPSPFIPAKSLVFAVPFSFTIVYLIASHQALPTYLPAYRIRSIDQ